MSLTQEIIGDVVIEKINLSRATYTESEELKEKLNKNLQDGMLKTAVDLSGCKYMDSTFLGVLVQSLKNYSQKGGNLVLVNPHGEVEILLDITGMQRIFKIFPTIEEAVKNFS